MALAGWLYRKKITLTGSTSGAQTDYSIPVTVNYGSGTDSGANVYCGSKCKADFGDVRFTAADGDTLLGQWLDTKTDSGNAVFWVKVPSIGASPATLDVYVYYGKASASLASSIADAFLLGDDFEQKFGCGIQRAEAPLEIPCPYTGGTPYQATHPSVVDMGSAWNGYRYWMAFTPYPLNDNTQENPCVVASNNKTSWVVPSGLTNPIVPYPGSGKWNADTELVHNDDTDELWIYFKLRQTSPSVVNKIYAVKSANGTSWTDLDGGTISTSNLGTDILGSLAVEEVSPCVIKNGETWGMWTWAYGTALRYRTSSDGRTWSAGTTCTRAHSTGQSDTITDGALWHMSVRYISSKSKYVMLACPKVFDSDYIYCMTSTNATAWTAAAAPVLVKKDEDWDDMLYRPTFVYDSANDAIDVWYGARTNSTNNLWRTGYTSADWDDFEARISNESSWNISAIYHQLKWKTSDARSKRGSQSLEYWKPNISTDMYGYRSAPLAVGYEYSADFYDDGKTNIAQLLRIYNGTVRIGLGVRSATSNTKYIYHKDITYTAGSVDRSNGWHKFSIRCVPGNVTEFYVDGSLAGSITDGFTNTTQVRIDSVSTTEAGSLYWDDARVRPYVAVEPSVTAYAAEEYFPDDDTAPHLSLQSCTATSPTEATGTVTTDDGNGTLYFLASENATETAATIKAALSQSVTTAGEQTISLSALDPETTYYLHFVQINGASLESSVISTAAWATPEIVYPAISATAAAVDSHSVSCTVTTDTVGGVIYGLLNTSATTPSAATIVSTATDTETVTDAGEYTLGADELDARTTYYWHVVHVDGDDLASNVVAVPVTTQDISIALALSNTAPAKLQYVLVTSDMGITAEEIEALWGVA